MIITGTVFLGMWDGGYRNIYLTRDVRNAYRMVSIPSTNVICMPALNPSINKTTRGLLSPSSIVTFIIVA